VPRPEGMPSRISRSLLLLALVSSVGLTAGPASAQEASRGWAFASLPMADLWFHGMALVDPVGPGPNPLYDPAYPNEVRRAKEGAGISATDLDVRLGYFREVFRRDPAFEVLHFLPLYFSRAGRTEVFAALNLLAGTEGEVSGAPSARTSFGMAAVGSVLTTPSQRSILGEFVTALEAEWTAFFESHWQGAAGQRGQVQNSLRDAWGRDYLPALAPFLRGIGMPGGMVSLVPSIGIEGRIFGGNPQDPTDNVLIVSAPSSPEDGLAAVYSMLRELSFPLVRRVMDKTGVTAESRGEEESIAARAAIRSGALILEIRRPDDLMAYQQFFLSRAGRSAPTGAATEDAFRDSFSLEVAFEEALREEIVTTITEGGVG